MDRRTKPQRCAVVVGGSGSLGSRVAALLRERSYTVISTFWSTTPASLSPYQVRFDVADGTGEAQLRAALDATRKPLAAVVYSAGVRSSKQELASTPVDELAHLHSVNAIGLVRSYQALAEQARTGSARVVAISSDASSTVRAKNGPYSASKASLEALAQTLAREEALFGVRVNVLAPSLIESPMANCRRSSKVALSAHRKSRSGGVLRGEVSDGCVMAAPVGR